MFKSAICSAYVVHLQVVGLDNTPFPKANKLRKIWRPFFGRSNCLKSLYPTICRSPSARLSPRHNPFISNFSSFCLHAHSFHLLGNRNREELIEVIGGNSNDFDNELEYCKFPLFGYDPSLEDQRMNLIYLEGCKPLFLKAKIVEKIKAEGKVFIHVYPSGYVVLFFATALYWNDWVGVKELNKAIAESRPWRLDNEWIWNSRVKDGKLFEHIRSLKNDMRRSFFGNQDLKFYEGPWHSAIKLTSTIREEQAVREVLSARDRFKVLTIEKVDPDVKYGNSKYVVASPQGIICNFHPRGLRRAKLRFFWKIVQLYEFVCLKDKIYRDYCEYFRAEAEQLRNFRQSLKRKVTKEDVLKFGVYDHKIPYLMLALDKHIRAASPFHRCIYSTISKGTNFDQRRKQVFKLLDKWEREIEKWEHPFTMVWKKIRLLLGVLLKGKIDS